MSEYTFRFLINQAAGSVVFSAADEPSPMTPGTLAGWSAPSYELMDGDAVANLVEDGGDWVGTVHVLPGGVFNMTATYFPVKGQADNIQVAGPIRTAANESRIAVVGGGGKFAGARGEARCVMSMADAGVPLYRYALTFQV